MAEPETIKPRHFKELLVWQKGMELAKLVYHLTAAFPAEEKYGSAAQMRRAAVSIPSNIAEGQARYGTREFVNFLSRASGSLAELETQVLLSVDLGYCNATQIKPIAGEIGELQRMLAAIRRKLPVV
ncbi:MAG: four helix bundle protein [Candidatus Acidiferrales bacterium]